MKVKLSIILTILVLFAVTTMAAAPGGRLLSATLTGEAEVPGPGDADGSGMARVRLSPVLGVVCFVITVADIEPATAAHIHEGAAGVSGGVVVNFDVPNNGLNGCVSGVDRELIKAIRQSPSGYYVNVHNEEFPAGAIRGQLTQ